MFAGRLAEQGIEQLADVRRYPASRRNPHFNREALAVLVRAEGIEHRWFEDLGGRRAARETGPDGEESPNQGLTQRSFRQYADYMQTSAFQASFGELVGWLGQGRTALLCAEALWWKCHRRLLADLLVARGGEVLHILGNGRTEPHRLWDVAVGTPSGLMYPPESE